MLLGFIGLGRMGMPMVLNLHHSEHRVKVYSRNQQKLQEFSRANGLERADSVVQLAAECDIIFTMLANDQAVEDVYRQGLAAAKPQQIWVEMSTISPTLSLQLHQLAQQANKRYLDAPVSGSIDAAREQRLVFMLGCNSPPDQDIAKLLLLMGRQYHCMGKPGSGHVAKLLINCIIHSQNQILAEVLTLSSRAELDHSNLIDLLLDSAASSPMYRFRRNLYSGNSNEVAFALELAAKDMMLAGQLGQKYHLNLPQIKVNSDLLAHAAAAGYAAADMAAMKDYLHQINEEKSTV